MEPSRFDDLTKALATATSRRRALKTIAATSLGSILGLAGIGTAYGAPKCHGAGLGCDTDSNCCSGLFCNNGTCCSCDTISCNRNSQCCSGNCDLSTHTCVFCCFTGETLIAMADGT